MPIKKLTPEDVDGIRYGYHEEAMSLGLLAHLYRVSRTQIWRIVNGKQHSKRLNIETVSSQGSETGFPNRLNSDLDLLRILKGHV